MDEMNEYRKRIERRYDSRRLKNDRRKVVHPGPKFWDIGTIVNAIILAIVAVWFYFAVEFTGGSNG